MRPAAVSELRIDVPIVKATPPPAPTPMAPWQADRRRRRGGPAAKRLTRLEMLRLEQEEREKAAMPAQRTLRAEEVNHGRPDIPESKSIHAIYDAPSPWLSSLSTAAVRAADAD